MQGSILIYCPTIAETDQLAEYLTMNGIKAEAYHSKRSPDERERVVHAFLLGMSMHLFDFHNYSYSLLRVSLFFLLLHV